MPYKFALFSDLFLLKLFSQRLVEVPNFPHPTWLQCEFKSIIEKPIGNLNEVVFLHVSEMTSRYHRPWKK